MEVNLLMVRGEISFNSLDFTRYAISLVENELIFQIVWFVRKSGLEWFGLDFSELKVTSSRRPQVVLPPRAVAAEPCYGGSRK